MRVCSLPEQGPVPDPSETALLSSESAPTTLRLVAPVPTTTAPSGGRSASTSKTLRAAPLFSLGYPQVSAVDLLFVEALDRFGRSPVVDKLDERKTARTTRHPVGG